MLVAVSISSSIGENTIRIRVRIGIPIVFKFRVPPLFSISAMEVHLALVPGPQYPDFAQNLGDSLRQFLLDVGVRFHTHVLRCNILTAM